MNGARIEFDESMSGYIGKGQTDSRKGYEVGKRQETDVRFDVRIKIDDLNRFLKISHHQAALTGTVTSELFGGTHEISDGIFNLFSILLKRKSRTYANGSPHQYSFPNKVLISPQQFIDSSSTARTVQQFRG